MPLILSRKIGESVTVTGPATIRIVGIHKQYVRVAVAADKIVQITRSRHAPKPKPEGKR